MRLFQSNLLGMFEDVAFEGAKVANICCLFYVFQCFKI